MFRLIALAILAVSRDLASSHGSFLAHADAVAGYGLATPLALALAGKRSRRPPERCLPQQAAAWPLPAAVWFPMLWFGILGTSGST